MKAPSMKLNKLAKICILLLVCSILVTLMPHTHKCGDVECSVCDFARTYKESLVLSVSLFISLFGIILFASLSFRCDIILYPRSNTLVGRKVKLSD